MGKGTHECDRNHGFPGRDGARWDPLGYDRSDGRSKYSADSSAVLVLAALTLTHLLRHPWSIDFTMTAHPDSVPVAVMNIVHNLLYRPEPKDGPVLVTVEFQVDRSRGSKFVALMREVRLIHLRNGAYSWQLFEDPSRLNTFRIEMMVPSWTQYMLQQERMTKADGDVIAQAESLHMGPNPPEVRTYLGVNKELLSHRHRDAATVDSRPGATRKGDAE